MLAARLLLARQPLPCGRAALDAQIKRLTITKSSRRCNKAVGPVQSRGGEEKEEAHVPTRRRRREDEESGDERRGRRGGTVANREWREPALRHSCLQSRQWALPCPCVYVCVRACRQSVHSLRAACTALPSRQASRSSRIARRPPQHVHVHAHARGAGSGGGRAQA